MNTITIHTKNKKDLKKIVALAEKLKAVIDPIEEKSPYNPEFVAKIRRSEKQIERGKCTKVDANDIWKSIL